MAGRPVKMAEKIVALDSKMTEVARLFLDYIPSEYSTKRPDDPLGQVWHNTMMAISEAEERIEVLSEALCDKANITWEQAKARIAELQAEAVRPKPVATGT